MQLVWQITTSLRALQTLLRLLLVLTSSKFELQKSFDFNIRTSRALWQAIRANPIWPAEWKNCSGSFSLSKLAGAFIEIRWPSNLEGSELHECWASGALLTFLLVTRCTPSRVYLPNAPLSITYSPKLMLDLSIPYLCQWLATPKRWTIELNLNSF